jgi:hypothetical protein
MGSTFQEAKLSDGTSSIILTIDYEFLSVERTAKPIAFSQKENVISVFILKD